jgi:hypothetical protein
MGVVSVAARNIAHVKHKQRPADQAPTAGYARVGRVVNTLPAANTGWDRMASQVLWCDLAPL